MEVTKEIFARFEVIRTSSIYLMLNDFKEVSDLMGVDVKTYFDIVNHYDKYKEKYKDLFDKN